MTRSSLHASARRDAPLVRVIVLSVITGLLILLAPHDAAAQVGVTTDILTGTITGPEGEPLLNAVVVATSLESGVRRTTLTDARGRYTLIFPDGGGRYDLQVARIGMSTEQLLVAAGPDADVLLTDVRLSVAPLALGEVTVLVDADRPVLEASGQDVDGDWLSNQPITPGILNEIAALDPGIVALETTDSIGSGGFSVLGQRPDLNHVSVDGASFGSPRGGATGELGIPPEAVRLTRVITNTYDVSQGQFSGGQISATTRGGGNRPQGSATYSLFEPRLQFTNDSPLSRAYTQHRFSGGYGGPIVRDKAFYFISASARHRTQDFASLVQADLAALEQLGAHPDSVARFFNILDSHALNPLDPVPIGEELIDEVSLFARFDFNLSDRHSLMVRGDARSNNRGGTRISSLGLPHSGGDDASDGAGAMVGLTSKFGPDFINEFRAYLARADSDAVPYFPVPEGRVRVASFQADGSRNVTNLVFGGNRSLPVTSIERTLEISNELSWLANPRHRVKLGALLSATSSAEEFSPTQFGTFTFNSLEDFAANRPASFSRSLTTSTRFGGGENLAVYLGDIFQYSRGLQLTYGLRLEGSFFRRSPEFNPEVEALFGRRTDRFPGEVHVTPRFGFTFNQAAPSRGAPVPLTLRGGVGIFRGRAPFSLFATAMDATGLPGAQVQVFCVGDGVPIPNWEFFRADPEMIPDSCADGEVRERSGRAPNVTVFTPDFGAPRSLRASLEVERRIGRNLQITGSFTQNYGTHLYGVTDLNLDPTPRFSLMAEDGRPVYVDPSQIVAGSGNVSLMGSRIHPAFGQVLELHSGLRSRSSQWSSSIRWSLPDRIAVRGSYSYTHAFDESSFSCCSALQGFGSPTTAGNPNGTEWSRSNFDRRHSVTANVGWTLRPWVELALNGRSASGTPFTPIVGSDINGDGSRNDRAFLFDPAVTADPAVGAGMSKLLTQGPNFIRSCLAEQLGQIAARNSCRGTRTSSLELRANLRPELPGTLGKRITASVGSQNLLTGMDQMINGSTLRGWGLRSSPDPTLLYPRGFDPVTRTFTYEVNEGFGNARRGRIPFGSPFQLQLEARVTLGPERQQQQGSGGR